MSTGAHQRSACQHNALVNLLDELLARYVDHRADLVTCNSRLLTLAMLESRRLREEHDLERPCVLVDGLEHDHELNSLSTRQPLCIIPPSVFLFETPSLYAFLIWYVHKSIL